MTRMKWLNLPLLSTFNFLTSLVFFFYIVTIVQAEESTSTGTSVSDPASSPIIPAPDVFDEPDFIEDLGLSEGPFNYMYRGFTQAAAYFSPLLRAPSTTSSSHIARVSTSQLASSPLSSAISSSTSKVPHRQMSFSTNTDSTAASSSSPMSSDTPPKPTLGLPSPEDIQESGIQLDVSGEGSTVKFDSLGPIVVNQDGSLSRISNWEQMTEIEKKNTLRILVKRNNRRLEALKAADVQPGESE
jgi:hypothetical protein